MTDWKFGDMVTMRNHGGLYMVVGEYLGERLAHDDKGPAVWVADISTEYSDAHEYGVVWAIESQLELMDE